MPDWHSPSELERDARIGNRLTCVWTGLYLWEIVTSLQFERDLMLRKRVFRWSLAPYLVCRYAQIISLICYVYTEAAMSQFNCPVLYAVVFFAELSTVTASVIFALRTMAVWTHRFVTACLWAMIVAVVILVLVSTARNRTQWNFVVSQCLYVDEGLAYAAIIRVRAYIMTFDAAILALVAYKLLAGFHARDNGNILRFVFGQGLLYFVVAFVGNAIAVGFLIWKPNYHVGLMATQPATLFSSIAACRSVRSLEKFMVRETKQIPRSLSTVTTGRVVLDTIMSDDDIHLDTMTSRI
ncbi:hypothetical protein CPB83DRAFT_851697 [Crepidotus variabilis]|uniref:Transmembrane protein n=1 Tax=Crepidotus variabilis TaxID=179855 RepID=A0A9P6EIT9_9AGAR|nr:hypothetical protein CPB83DRAFT_851697 [Crepidotus variabilis]